MPLNIKCVIVGDGTVGKTCLLMSYCQDQFPLDHIPTIFETYAATVNVGAAETATLLLFDTAGQEDYDRIRILSYPGTDVFLLCFSVVCPSSLQNVEERWVPELRSTCGQEVPIILVGTKVDLREDAQTAERLKRRNERPVTTDEGRSVAARIRAYRYVECSAMTRAGLNETFAQAILSILNPCSEKKKKKKARFCSLS